MTFGKRQYLKTDIPFANGDRESQTSFVEKAQTLTADVFAIDPGLVEYKQSRGIWVILKGGVGAAEGFLMHPNNRMF